MQHQCSHRKMGHMPKPLGLAGLALLTLCFVMMLGKGAVAQMTDLPFDTATASDPLELYGPEVVFDVYRKGNLVGEHRVSFERLTDGRIQATSRFEIAIKVLFITAYRYTYDSIGIWQDNEMLSMSARVNDNGDEVTLEAIRTDTGYDIAGRDGAYTAEAPLFPTTHWNTGILTQSRVLNTLTGNLDEVTITPSGQEMVLTNAGEVEATKFVYTGELDVTVWYDAEGRWVNMRFPGKDGTEITYTCRSCQG